MTTVGRKVRRSATPTWLALGIGISIAACGRASDEQQDRPPPTPGGQTDPFEDATATSLEFPDFEPRRMLTLVAGASQDIRVQVQPPGEHTIRFALVGQSRDAFLSANTSITAPDGSALITLTVLSASQGFAVRAAVGRNVEVPLRILVQEANLGSLRLTPRYPGQRMITGWSASVHVGESCANLMGPPFPDGKQLTTSSGESVQIDRVPAGLALAVVVRADQIAGGCRSIGALQAGTTTLAEVDIVDRPLQIGGIELPLSLSVDATPPLNPALDELAFRAVNTLPGTASNDLAALLDAMSGLASDSVAFEQARRERDWAGILIAGLEEGLPGSGLRSLIHEWMRTGLAHLSDPGAIVGTLSSASAEGQASLNLGSVTGLPAAGVGFTLQNPATLSADPDDVLRVGTTLSWLPAPFLAAAAERVAIAENPGTRASAADGMAQVFDCAAVASLLVGAGSSPAEAFPDCDEDCMLALCDGAMQMLWSRVSSANLPSVAWQILGAAHAQIDASARPTSVSGSWIGSLTLPEFVDAQIQGPFSGGLGAN